jgi:hypothetical protein
MLMTPTDISYLSTLSRMTRIDTVIECPECGEVLPDSYLDQLEFARDHGLIDRREIGAPTSDLTLVIGCEGYHILDASTGREKDHSDC